MSTRQLLSAAAVVLLMACAITPPFQEEAWEMVKKDLKAPSSAKLAEFKAYDVSPTAKKAYFLRTSYPLQWLFITRKSLKTNGRVVLFVLKTMMNYMQKQEATDLMAVIRTAAPSQAKTLDKCEVMESGKLGTESFDPTKKELPAVIKALEDQIRQVAARESARYDMAAASIEAKNIFINYDSQNSYGAMIRGLAHFYGVRVGNLRHVLDPSEPFDNALVGLPEDTEP